MNESRSTPLSRLLNLSISEPETDVDYFKLRKPGILYKAKTSTLGLSSQDHGEPYYRARQVFDEVDYRADTGEVKPELGEDQEAITLVKRPRVQVEAMVTREAGRIRSVEFQRIKTQKGEEVLQRVLSFDRAGAAALKDFFQRLDHIDPGDTPDNRRYLDATTRMEVTRDEETLLELLRTNSEISAKVFAEDQELSRLRRVYERRDSLRRFEELIEDDTAPESDFQSFFEGNQWLIGLALDVHLLTGVDEKRLEQVTTGYSIAGAGKRIDALLKTAGVVNSLAFAEIKKPSTELVEKRVYRSEVWGPTHEFGGAIVQVQQTVHKALATIVQSKLTLTDDAGAAQETIYSYSPRAYVVAGRLDQFVNSSGQVEDYRFRAFESFRRSIAGVTILTYDEVLERARAAVGADEADGQGAGLLTQ